MRAALLEDARPGDASGDRFRSRSAARAAGVRSQPGYFVKTPPNYASTRMRVAYSRFKSGTFCTAGLLGRRRPISGHVAPARLNANRHGYSLRRSWAN